MKSFRSLSLRKIKVVEKAPISVHAALQAPAPQPTLAPQPTPRPTRARLSVQIPNTQVQISNPAIFFAYVVTELDKILSKEELTPEDKRKFIELLKDFKKLDSIVPNKEGHKYIIKLLNEHKAKLGVKAPEHKKTSIGSWIKCIEKSIPKDTVDSSSTASRPEVVQAAAAPVVVRTRAHSISYEPSLS